MAQTSTPIVHFGGPDCPERALRNLLEQHVHATPPGGWISWATYYFRDIALADALIAASRRGVKVNFILEGDPRLRGANDAVIERLATGLPPHSLRIFRPSPRMKEKDNPHLHSKLYAFSHPAPHIFVGSFNPSGNEPEDALVIREIGDQDRGHNMLVEYHDPIIIDSLLRHMKKITPGDPRWMRFRPRQNKVIRAKETTIYFYPRIRTNIVERSILGVDKARITGTISHLKKRGLANVLARVARSGGDVRLIVHDTERRVPEAVFEYLRDAGVHLLRYRHPNELPLHTKFLLVENDEGRTAYFGSLNFNRRSEKLNQEVLIVSHNQRIFEILKKRFEYMLHEIAEFERNFPAAR